LENEKIVWKPVKDYEGLYEVNQFGQVKSVERRVKCCGNGTRLVKERILAKDLYCEGYYRVQLFKEGNKKNKRIHRLVAEAFIPNPEGKSEVNHKDFNKLNNYVENLEWCTGEENIEHYQESLITG
jgi:hypothetical protein